MTINNCHCGPGTGPDPLGDVLSRQLDTSHMRRQAQDWARQAEGSAAAAAPDAGSARAAADSAAADADAARTDAAAAQQAARAAEQSAGAAGQASAKAEQAAREAAAAKAGAAADAERAGASEAAAAASAGTADAAAAAAQRDAQTAQQSAQSAAEDAAAAGKSAAAAQADAAAARTDQINAGAAAQAAAGSAADAGRYADTAKSYAVGTGLGEARPDEATENAAYYYCQAKRISQGLQGALLPMGSIHFAELAATAAGPGAMYNVTDAFTSDETFKEGTGHRYAAGTNVYRTVDGYWDALPGIQVTGVKGNAESTYRLGQVNLTPEDIGAMDAAAVQAALEASEQRVGQSLQEQTQTVDTALETARRELTETMNAARDEAVKAAEDAGAALETTRQELTDAVGTAAAAAAAAQSTANTANTKAGAALPKAGGTVTGTLILSRTTAASGTADNKPALMIGAAAGAHLEFDGNDIMAKATGTTVAALNLNSGGGAVSVGAGGLSMKGAIAMGNHKITGLATPTANTDAATKAYVDNQIKLITATVVKIKDLNVTASYDGHPVIMEPSEYLNSTYDMLAVTYHSISANQDHYVLLSTDKITNAIPSSKMNPYTPTWMQSTGYDAIMVYRANYTGSGSDTTVKDRVYARSNSSEAATIKSIYGIKFYSN